MLLQSVRCSFAQRASSLKTPPTFFRDTLWPSPPYPSYRLNGPTRRAPGRSNLINTLLFKSMSFVMPELARSNHMNTCIDKLRGWDFVFLLLHYYVLLDLAYKTSRARKARMLISLWLLEALSMTALKLFGRKNESWSKNCINILIKYGDTKAFKYCHQYQS